MRTTNYHHHQHHYRHHHHFIKSVYKALSKKRKSTNYTITSLDYQSVSHSYTFPTGCIMQLDVGEGWGAVGVYHSEFRGLKVSRNLRSSTQFRFEMRHTPANSLEIAGTAG